MNDIEKIKETTKIVRYAEKLIEQLEEEKREQEEKLKWIEEFINEE